MRQKCSQTSKSSAARKSLKDQQHPTHSCHVQAVTETVAALMAPVAHKVVQVLLVQVVADPMAAISKDDQQTERLKMNEQKDNRKVVIELDNVKRYFQVGSETVKALRGVSFKIYEGEFVTIQGTSGSGKSTLLNQLGCLDTPTSGEYYLDGTPVRKMSKNQRAKLRNRKIGFVFQNYNLLAKTTAVENVELPLMYNNKYSAKQRREAAIKALQEVGLGDRLDHKSNQMSGCDLRHRSSQRRTEHSGHLRFAHHRHFAAGKGSQRWQVGQQG